MKLALIIIIGLISVCSFGQSEQYKQWLTVQKLPRWFIISHQKTFDRDKYEFSEYINPYYLEADFDGDNKLDIVVAVIEKKTQKKGLLIYHQDSDKYYVVGAGQTIGNGGDDFEWMNIWKIYRKSELRPGMGETEIIKLTSNAIFVEKSESASGVIYWDGNKYKWYQQGD